MAKGRKTGGRRPGSPNKVTSAARSAFLATFNRLEGSLHGWLEETAKGIETPLVVKGTPVMDDTGKPVMIRMGADPGKASDLLIRMAEYHFPKLGRQEHVGEDGGPIIIEVRKLG